MLEEAEEVLVGTAHLQEEEEEEEHMMGKSGREEAVCTTRTLRIPHHQSMELVEVVEAEDKVLVVREKMAEATVDRTARVGMRMELVA